MAIDAAIFAAAIFIATPLSAAIYSADIFFITLFRYFSLFCRRCRHFHLRHAFDAAADISMRASPLPPRCAAFTLPPLFSLPPLTPSHFAMPACFFRRHRLHFPPDIFIFFIFFFTATAFRFSSSDFHYFRHYFAASCFRLRFRDGCFHAIFAFISPLSLMLFFASSFRHATPPCLPPPPLTPRCCFATPLFSYFACLLPILFRHFSYAATPPPSLIFHAVYAFAAIRLFRLLMPLSITPPDFIR